MMKKGIITFCPNKIIMKNNQNKKSFIKSKKNKKNLLESIYLKIKVKEGNDLEKNIAQTILKVFFVNLKVTQKCLM